MGSNLIQSCFKGLLVGLCFGIGLITTIAVGVTVSTSFTAGDMLTAESLTVIKNAVESIPGWQKGETETDAVYTDGNVGIGTTSPTRGALEVVGPNMNPVDGFGQISVLSTDPWAIDKGGSIVFGGPRSDADLTRSFAMVAGRKEDSIISRVNGYLQFSTRENGGDLLERMRITSIGDVGIGTSTPGSKLSVVGLPIYADNATALVGGLLAGDMYRTAGGAVMVVY